MAQARRTMGAPAATAAAALFVALLLGCAAGPRFAQRAADLPAVPAGKARLYVYRNAEPYETLAWTGIVLNGRSVGVLPPGAVLYRDLSPGTYTVTLTATGLYPDQFKTVAVEPGETTFIRVDSLRSWQQGPVAHGDTFTVSVVDPEFARTQIAGLAFADDPPRRRPERRGRPPAGSEGVDR